MPALKLFDKVPTPLADDYVYIVLRPVLLSKTVQLILAVFFVLGVQWDRRNELGDEQSFCVDETADEQELIDVEDAGDDLIIVYLALTGFGILFGVAVEMALFYTSRQGAPAEQALRSRVKRLMEVKILVATPLRVITFLHGQTVLIILKRFCECFVRDENSGDLMDMRRCTSVQQVHTTVVLLWVIQIAEMAVAGLVWLFVFSKGIRKLLERRSRNVEHVTSLKRCLACLGCLTNASSDGMAETAEFLTDIFDTGAIKWEITLSDITAAILMISAERKKQREKMKFELRKEDEKEQEVQPSNPTVSTEPDTHSPVRGPGMIRKGSNLMTLSFRSSSGQHTAHYEQVEKKRLDRDNDWDCAAIAAGGRFARFAHAVYGGSETLGHKLSCRQVPENETVLGDSKHGANSKAFGKETRGFIEQNDILYESWLQAEGDHHRIPYTIVVDHKWKAVCVCIRGTASLNDAVTDGAQELDDLEKLKHKAEFAGIAGVGKVHSGFQRRALWLYSDLERVKEQSPRVKEAFDKCSHPGSDYRMITTGHSLGAAVAAVVGYLLRPRYPDIRCYGFGCPGCVFTTQVETKSFVTTFVMDNDIVPRLSLQSITALRDEILELLSRISTPKYQVLAGRGELSPNPLVGTRLANVLAAYKEAKLNAVNEGQLEKEVDETENVETDDVETDDVETGVRNDVNDGEAAADTLEIPGRVIHLIRKDDNSNPLDNDDHYAAKHFIPVWAKRDDFNAIPMTKSMVADHGTIGYYQALENLAKEGNLDGVAFTVDGRRMKSNNKNSAKTSTSLGFGAF